MKKVIYVFFLLFFVMNAFPQKDSLQLGDRYAEDQIYASISYAQFYKQPQVINKSSFSYAISAGFMKDFILNKQGTFAVAIGLGYGFDFFNHKLKVEEINQVTSFNTATNIRSNVFKAHNLEIPIELRWRTSTAQKYNFWRIYGGVKFLYNMSNKFQFIENDVEYQYKNVSAYNNFQYGLTLSAGFDEFNVNLFYNLTPVFKNATIQGETIDTRILKFGFIFYIL